MCPLRLEGLLCVVFLRDVVEVILNNSAATPFRPISSYWSVSKSYA